MVHLRLEGVYRLKCVYIAELFFYIYYNKILFNYIKILFEKMIE